MSYRSSIGSDSKGFIGAVAAGVIIFIIVIAFFSGMSKVPAGYAGIVYNMNGGIEEKALPQGWHWVGPTREVTKYSIGIEQSYLTSGEDGDSENDDSFEVPTSDGKGLTVDLTFTYRFDVDKIADIFTRFKGQSGKEVRDSFIKPNIIAWTKEVTAKYPVTEILGEERANLNIALSEYIHEKFIGYGIIVENVSLINIDADPQTRESVQKKVNAQQELELAQIEQKTASIQAQTEKEKALIDAQKEKEVAEINAEKARIKAEGEAEATKIRAEAEAKANREIAESLTPLLVEKIKAEAWNGELPQYTGSDSMILKTTE